MSENYLGVDIGSISTKAVITDKNDNIILSKYIWTEADPINATKKLIKSLKKDIYDKKLNNIDIVAVGTTGSARKLVGEMLNAQIVKNEITAHAIGTLSRCPDVSTIFEIGGQDSKIIIIKDKVVVDYAMNTLCAAGTGAFLSSQARRLGVKVEDIGKIAVTSTNPCKIAAKCTVFAESDMIHKAQVGYTKNDILAGLCKAVVSNYLNNVGKGKKIQPKIVFQGGVSKNAGVVKYFKEATDQDIYVDEASHLMGALGIAILAKKYGKKQEFNFDIVDQDFITKAKMCNGCSNNCEVIYVYRDNEVIDKWGNRCEHCRV